jgi:hypothetical protein
LHPERPAGFNPVEIAHPVILGDDVIDGFSGFHGQVHQDLPAQDVIARRMQQSRPEHTGPPCGPEPLSIRLVDQEALFNKGGAQAVNGLLGQAYRLVDLGRRHRFARRSHDFKNQQGSHVCCDAVV